MARRKKFSIPGAGTLPGFGVGKGGKLHLLDDARPAKTGVFNSFGPLENLEEEAPAAPEAVTLAVQEAVVAAPAAGSPAGVDAAPAVAPAAVADAPRWSCPRVFIAIVAWALLFFALVPVAGGSRLLSGRRA